MVLALAVYFLRTLTGFVLFPFLARFKTGSTLVSLNGFLGVLLLAGGAVVAIVPSMIVEFVVYSVMAWMSAVVTDAVQRRVDSELEEIVVPEHRATWLSLANAVGFLLYGLLSLCILVFELQMVALSFFCICLCLTSWTSAIRLFRLRRRPTLKQ
jgi:hypothetical protein